LGCNNAKLPSTRPEFWRVKLEGNVARDRRAVDALIADGWRVLTVWERATRDPESLARIFESLSSWIEGSAPFGEISVSPFP